MHIYIPTKGRGPRLQKTADILAPVSVFPITLVCPPEEVTGFQAAGYTAVACPAERIGATRQWIINNSPDKSVLMLDDDLGNWACRIPGSRKYLPASRPQLHQTLMDVAAALEEYAHVGVGARLFANNQEDTVLNGRITRAWGLRADIIKEHDLKFTCPVDDLEMTIQLIRMGYSNWVTYLTVQDQKESQSPGGASTYRTLEYHNACHEQINRWHPDYTRLVEKATKAGWFDGKPRKEVVISWGKLVTDCYPAPIAERAEGLPRISRGPRQP
jgi:hypothetical protein